MVAAVVLTRDRRELLEVSLRAVLGQERQADRVIVVDNASTDGTAELLATDFAGVLVVRTEENLGATGGFDVGIDAAMASGADWIWLLDDDTIPRPDTLATLLAARDRSPDEPLLLASRVDWRDGEPHPMNMPTFRRRDPAAIQTAAERGLLPLRATTWVSLLVARQAVERSGRPDRRFFYQADDIEFTARVLRAGAGYFVPESVVEHRTPSKQTATSDARRFYHHVRNTILMLRGAAWATHEKPALAWVLLRSSIEYIRASGWSRASIAVTARAVRHGVLLPDR